VSLIAAGRFEEALEVVRRSNPFPGVCGRVCPAPCEAKCLRAEIEEPIAIAALKRFLADYELRRGIIPRLAVPSRSAAAGKRRPVAIVGAGPAGLTCAADLAREGYAVRVFEALPVPGGMLAAGIPPYRLPRDILRLEIEAIEALGVEIILDTRIGGELQLAELARSHDAVFLAVGAQLPRRLGLSGEGELEEGVGDWMRLLRAASGAGPGIPNHAAAGMAAPGVGAAALPRGGRVVVVGGGNTAIDSARAALRLGAGKVTVVYRRSREQMPAFEQEVRDAEEEGVRMEFLCSPARLLVQGRRLSGVACARMRLGEPDGSGRPSPLPAGGPELILPCDVLIPAVGQELEASVLSGEHDVRLSGGGLIEADPLTLATSQPGVFAGGDAVMGPATVVEAIAAGHRAAASIQRFLTGAAPGGAGMEEWARRLKPPPSEREELAAGLRTPGKRGRVPHSRLAPSERRASFVEIAQVFTQAQATAEAERCLRCGPCHECTSCVGVCENRQLLVAPASGPRRLPRQGAAGSLRLLRVSRELHRAALAGEAGGELSISCGGERERATVLTATVDEELCRGCGLCEEACPHRAVRVSYRGQGVFCAVVEQEACRGCGVCVSVCPTGAMEQRTFTRAGLGQGIIAALRGSPSGVVVLQCHWSGVTGDVLAGLAGATVPVPCAGRVEPGQLLAAFEQGARAALVLACAGEQCHHGRGSGEAERHGQRLAAVMELLGLQRERLAVLRAGPGLEGQVAGFLRALEGLPAGGGKERAGR
jgi:NADPH-dependent glutamate synthase beta subunit-like oxidoreductase/coenzyme F420-reducing hydrogenase delta subunit/NAD-dependent dihydropyrimidine dehydrogenase PreA subunit